MSTVPEKNFLIGMLSDLYGGLLTGRQREILDLYYNDDLSLSEVSEECGITRQGVREALKKAEEQLLLYEERLGLLKRQQQEEERKREIVSEMDRLRGEGVDLGALPQLIGVLLGEQNAEDEAL